MTCVTGVGIVDLSFNVSWFTHEQTLRQLELFGEKALPRVREFDVVPA